MDSPPYPDADRGPNNGEGLTTAGDLGGTCHSDNGSDSDEFQDGSQFVYGTQYDYSRDFDRSPIVKYGILSPEMQRIHGRRSFDPADDPDRHRDLETTPTRKPTLLGTSRKQDTFPSPVSGLIDDSDPFISAPGTSTNTTQRFITTEVQLVDIEIELYKTKLNTLKRKYNSDVGLLEDEIKALKKKRDALNEIQGKKAGSGKGI
ncbi:hypothetical protein NMY22_g12911 [Coprinellus aureogranulatus]|nr:hypothetical protein NMY22_g12911 [Coprinellus aureogranulatus]